MIGNLYKTKLYKTVKKLDVPTYYKRVGTFCKRDVINIARSGYVIILINYILFEFISRTNL